ncbi:hypothetical protein DFJ74DRAFT_693035 [Hyaloraphidium curvatum]|nr:hypothetical protein DFJ74DRAFT_693035 [Hyaloraphidium curvatum]
MSVAADIPAQFRVQAIASPAPASSSETRVFRHPLADPDFSRPPMAFPPPDERNVTSAVELFRRGLRHAGPDAPCLGQRLPAPDGKPGPFSFQSYAEIDKRFAHVAAALGALTGLEPHSDDSIIGIFMNNCVEWILTDYGAAYAGIVTATLYPTFDDPAIEYIFNLCKIPLVVLMPAQLPRLLSLLPKVPTLKHAVVVDTPFARFSIPDDARFAAERAGVRLWSWAEFENLGRAEQAAGLAGLVAPPADRMDRTYTICFTSGTTGTPKGAMITHGNIVVVSYSVALASVGLVDPDTVHLSYMPCAHIYERLLLNVLFSLGARVGVYRGDALLLFEDIQALGPTFFPSVPRILNRLVGQLRGMADALPAAEKASFERAYAGKLALLRQGIMAADTEFDADPTLRKMKAVLGGRIKSMNSGAAPIAPENLEFMRIVFGASVKEGYGQTENTAASHSLLTGDVWSPYGSTVGTSFPHSEWKLVDVPEMNYFAQPKEGNPRGEIWVRSASVMKGYYKVADKTAEALTPDGWLRTGDIGELLPNYTLKIIDRLKHILKLSQGEYVAPERIETIYLRHPVLAQLYVHGDSLRSYLVAVAVPDPEALTRFASKLGITAPFPALCADPRVRGELLAQLTALGKGEGLHGFEQPKALHLSPDPFTVENNLLTPTAKSKRNELRAHFKGVIDGMYKDVGLD